MAQILFVVVSGVNGRTKTGFNSHGTISKDDGNANFFRSGHMQRPK